MESIRNFTRWLTRGGNASPPLFGKLEEPLAQTRAGGAQFGTLYSPEFDYDGLRTDPKVIHNHDFMKDERYVAAFQAGHMALGLDHPMYWRLHVALFFARRGLALEGDFVECGVWRGFLSAAITNYLGWERVNKTLFLFDTFEGLVDDLLTDAERANVAKLEHLRPYYRDCFDAVQKNFAQYSNVRIIKGIVPDSLKTQPIERVAYLSLDMNCAVPEIEAAEFFWDRLANSAAIVLDDYGFVSYEEQKRAFDDFARRKGTQVLALPTGQGVILKE